MSLNFSLPSTPLDISSSSDSDDSVIIIPKKVSDSSSREAGTSSRSSPDSEDVSNGARGSDIISTRQNFRHVPLRVDTSKPLGVQSVFNGSSYVVEKVEEGSQAQELKVPVGSHVISVNDVKLTKHRNLEDLWPKLNKFANLVVYHPPRDLPVDSKLCEETIPKKTNVTKVAAKPRRKKRCASKTTPPFTTTTFIRHKEASRRVQEHCDEESLENDSSSNQDHVSLLDDPRRELKSPTVFRDPSQAPTETGTTDGGRTETRNSSSFHTVVANQGPMIDITKVKSEERDEPSQSQTLDSDHSSMLNAVNEEVRVQEDSAGEKPRGLMKTGGFQDDEPPTKKMRVSVGAQKQRTISKPPGRGRPRKMSGSKSRSASKPKPPNPRGKKSVKGWSLSSEEGSESDSNIPIDDLKKLEADDLKIGDRAFARWDNSDNGWFWGVITNRVVDAHGKAQYSVWFDDDDYKENVPPEDVVGVAPYREWYHEEPKPLPKQRVSHMRTPKGNGVDKSLSLKQLHEKRCRRDCFPCRRGPCQKCSECLSKKKARFCLQKMCANIEHKKRCQPAVGFPSGWKYYCAPAARSDGVCCSMWLLTPNGREYGNNWEESANTKKFVNFEECADKLNRHVGMKPAAQQNAAADIGEEPERNHSAIVGNHNSPCIVGKGIYQEWTDIKGQKKHVYGVIEEVDGDCVRLKYIEESRQQVNSCGTICDSNVKETGDVCYEDALGLCNSFLCMTENQTLSNHRLRWIVPDYRCELKDLGLGGEETPRLKLHTRGFCLEFNVKPSSLPDAGLGVFLKVKPLLPSAGQQFRLKAGEFVDLGLYAPFRIEDKKKECVHFFKNYVHSFKPEAWAFDVSDTNTDYFDITEDFSGDVHSIARQHIPCYVNECISSGQASIHSRQDPEGNLHYLLGDANGDGFCLNCDSVSREVFIDYGDVYELVRVRKGYSRLKGDDYARKLQELENNDSDYLERFESYSSKQIGDCVDFCAIFFF